jgi:hypothetical protein
LITLFLPARDGVKLDAKVAEAAAAVALVEAAVANPEAFVALVEALEA